MMDNIKLTGTDRTPEIDFDYASNRFCLGGFSYPENVKDFYGPIIDPLLQYLRTLKGATIQVIFSYNYYHSSSAQVLYNLFDAMEDCVKNDNVVNITWCFETGDDSMQESGEDWAEEVEHVHFSMKEVDAL